MNAERNIDSAYRSALKFARSHYENFPVVSFLIPKKLRKHVAVIYWFARTADDFADEGDFSEGERLEKLNDFEFRFKQLTKGKASSGYEVALANTIAERNLSPQHFYNLLKAFKQDVIKKRYKSYAELLDYCSNSANPVGRLILELFNIRNDEANFYSDKICTALQITNFLQDVSVDYQKGRIYLPKDDLRMFNVTEKVFEMKENNLNFKKLLQFNVSRTQKLFDEGKNLLQFIKGKLKFEIAWTVAGGEEILNKIKTLDFDVLNERPSLTKTDFIKLLFKSFSKN